MLTPEWRKAGRAFYLSECITTVKRLECQVCVFHKLYFTFLGECKLILVASPVALTSMFRRAFCDVWHPDDLQMDDLFKARR